MEVMLCRLRKYDPRRGHVLRRFTYRGIKFQEERGWYRVEKSVGDYLAQVHQIAADEHSPLAFDVCTEKEATDLDAKEKKDGTVRKLATDDIKISVPRTEGALTTSDLPESAIRSSGTKLAKKKRKSDVRYSG